MSKKNKKKLTLLDIYKGIRKYWNIAPATKIKKSKKLYNRNKSKQEFKKQLKEE